MNNNNNLPNYIEYSYTQLPDLSEYQQEFGLDVLTDEQKLLLTQLSYLDVTEEGMEAIRNGGVKISDLYQYLVNPNDQFPGNVAIDERLSKAVTDGLIGKNSVQTEAELLEMINNSGLGDLTITGIESDSKTGFQAMAFTDSKNNTGISYRGSDVDLANGGGSWSDWLATNIYEYATDNSAQRQQAFEFFEKHAGENNYLYGHSLGGNLTTHTLLEYSDRIQEAFTINGTPVSEKVVNEGNNKEILNSDKYNCNVIGGDVVAQLKLCEGYEDNINWIQNNGETDYSIISAHLIGAATLDENGQFVCTTKEEANTNMGKFETFFTELSQSIHEGINESGIGQYFDNAINNLIDKFTKEQEADNVDDVELG